MNNERKRIFARLFISLGYLTLYYLAYLQLLGLGLGIAVAAFNNNAINMCTLDAPIEAIVPTIDLGCALVKINLE